MTFLCKVFGSLRFRVFKDYYFNSLVLTRLEVVGGFEGVFKNACVFWVIILDLSSGREVVLFNSCFWKNRRLERVG